MRASVLIVLLGVLPFLGCQTSTGTQSEIEAPRVETEVDSLTTSQAPLSTCCRDAEQVAALDGQRVEIQGNYLKVNVSKKPPPLDLNVPGSALVRTNSVGVMLGVYYEASGMRSVEEIQSLHDKEVIVTGTIHARTPDQVHEGIPMQTMSSPYIDVETLRATP